jgi:hypothetical protein
MRIGTDRSSWRDSLSAAATTTAFVGCGVEIYALRRRGCRSCKRRFGYGERFLDCARATHALRSE